MADWDRENARTEPHRSDRPWSADDEVDITLIRWMLSLTPAQRLRVLQRNAASLLRLRRARTRA